MGTTVARLQRNMSAREFAEWVAYTTVTGPIGEERADYRTAMLAYVNASLWTKGVKLEDFLLFNLDKPQTTQTPQDILKKIQMVNAMLGGEDQTGNS